MQSLGSKTLPGRIRLAFYSAVGYNSAIKYPLIAQAIISCRVSKRLKADQPLGAFLYIIRAFGPQDGTLKGVPFFVSEEVSDLETERPNEHVPACQKLAIHIVVEDGRVQAVYVNCPLAQVDAEVLDLDDAKVSDDAELEFVRRSIAEAAGRCTKIY